MEIKNNNMKNYILVDPTEISLINEIELLPPKKKEKEDEKDAKAGGSKSQQQSTGIPGAGDAAPPTAEPPKPAEPTEEPKKEPDQTDTVPVDSGLIIEYLEWFIEGGYGTAKHREVAQNIIDATRGKRTTDIILDNWSDLIGLSLDPSPDIVEIPLGVTIKAIFEYLPKFIWTAGKRVAFGAAYGLEYVDTKPGGAEQDLPTWEEFKPDTENSPNWNAYLEYVDAVVDNIVQPFTAYIVSNAVWAVHARRKRNALYAAFGSDSEFMQLKNAEKMTPLEMKQFIDKQGRGYRGGIFYGFGNIAEEQVEKEMKALEASASKKKNIMSWEFDEIVEKAWSSLKRAYEKLKSPAKTLKQVSTSAAIGTVKTGLGAVKKGLGPATRGIYGKIAFLSILKGLGTERQDIYIDMLNANVRKTLDSSQIQLLDAEIERLQAANTDGSKSQRDIVFEAINDGKFGDESSRSQRKNLIKAIAETDSQTLTQYRKNVNNFVRQFMTSLSKKIPEASRSLARNTGEFIEDFKKGYVYRNDPLVQKAMQAKRDGQDKVWTGILRSVPGSSSLKRRVMVPVDDVLDAQRASLGMAAADEAKFAQLAAQATVNLKNAISQGFRRAKSVFKEQKQLTEAKKGDSFEAFADFAKSEQEKLDKEEKEANERFNKAFDVEGKEEEFEPIFQDMLQNEVDKIADSEELNSVIDSVFAEIEKEFNTTRQQLSQRLNSIPAAPEDGEQDTQPQTRVDVDGSDAPINIKGKVPPQAPVNENKIRISKDKLVRLISEQVKEQTQTVDVTKEQLVTLVAEEALKQVSRKK